MCVLCPHKLCACHMEWEKPSKTLDNSHKQLGNLSQRSVTSAFVGVRVATNLISHFLSSYGRVKIPIVTSNGLSWAQGHRWNEISEERIACPQTQEKCPLPSPSPTPDFWNHLWLLQGNIHTLLWLWNQLTNSFPNWMRNLVDSKTAKRGVPLIQRLQMGRISLGQNSRWEYSIMYRQLDKEKL